MVSNTGKTVHLLAQSKQLIALHSEIRNKNCSQADFIFYSKRIIRLLLEEALSFLPFESIKVETPTGVPYEALRATSGLVGVSVLRSGESMEEELRAICPSVRIGKILVQRDERTKLPTLFYSSFPKNIEGNYVMLLDPMLATGGSANESIKILLNNGVKEEKIIFASLVAAPEGIASVSQLYPQVQLVCSAIDKGLNEHAYIVPGIGDFGDRFFGTNQ